MTRNLPAVIERRPERAGVDLTTDELTQLAKVLTEIEGLRDVYDIFEPWCGNCDGWHLAAIANECADLSKRKACACDDPAHIFVGAHSCDGDAWNAAGMLLELLDRSKPLLRKLLAESRHG